MKVDMGSFETVRGPVAPSEPEQILIVPGFEMGRTLKSP